MAKNKLETKLRRKMGNRINELKHSTTQWVWSIFYSILQWLLYTASDYANCLSRCQTWFTFKDRRMKDVSGWVSKVNVGEDVCSSPTFTLLTEIFQILGLMMQGFQHHLVRNNAILRYCFLSNSGQRCWMEVNLWSAFSTAWLTFEPWLVCGRHKLHTCPLWGRSFKTVEVRNA